MLCIVIELCIVAILPRCWPFNQLDGAQQFFKLCLPVLVTKDRPVILFRTEGALTISIIVADRICQLVSIWGGALLLERRSLESILSLVERVTAIISNGTGKGHSNLLHTCVAEGHWLSRQSMTLPAI